MVTDRRIILVVYVVLDGELKDTVHLYITEVVPLRELGNVYVL